MKTRIFGSSLVSFEFSLSSPPAGAAREVRRWLERYQRKNRPKRRALSPGYAKTYVSTYLPGLRAAWPEIKRARPPRRRELILCAFGFPPAGWRRDKLVKLDEELFAMDRRLPANPKRCAVRILAAVRGVSVRLVEKGLASPNREN